jgi:tRNA U34 2-thiouridine synthase MnmA/TrmU
VKVVVLYSGGLDSSLALEIAKQWDAEVFPLHVCHQFLAINSLPKIKNLKTADVSKELLELVRNPRHGYGRNLNPCVDCRILMLKKAKEYMNKIKADFIVTGEVLDQRPLSQRLEMLLLVEKRADLTGLVVRPLSGQLLPETVPEKKGLIKKTAMYEIRGRSRKAELTLAKKFKITSYLSPSGGCLLTDPGFCRRLADLMRFQEKFTADDLSILKTGRHFRLSSEAKLVVGRNKAENEILEKMAGARNILLYVPDTGSPNALLFGDKKYIKTAAAITARYSDRKDEKSIEVIFQEKKKTGRIKVSPAKDDELGELRIV